MGWEGYFLPLQWNDVLSALCVGGLGKMGEVIGCVRSEVSHGIVRGNLWMCPSRLASRKMVCLGLVCCLTTSQSDAGVAVPCLALISGV